MEVQSTQVQTDRVLTVPNILSALRLLGVPLFLWLILVPEADVLAIAVLALAGSTDWLDGFLARRWHQISRVGQLLDPVADRLYILATLVGLLLRCSRRRRGSRSARPAPALAERSAGR